MFENFVRPPWCGAGYPKGLLLNCSTNLLLTFERSIRLYKKGLREDHNLLDGGSESFFAYLPSIGEHVYLRNRVISLVFKRTTSSYVSSNLACR